MIPYVALITAAVWAVVFYATRYVSLASILAAVSLPVLAYALHRGSLTLAVTCVIALFVVVRHRSNISRLMNGTEKRFDRKKADENKGDKP